MCNFERLIAIVNNSNKDTGRLQLKSKGVLGVGFEKLEHIQVPKNIMDSLITVEFASELERSRKKIEDARKIEVYGASKGFDIDFNHAFQVAYSSLLFAGNMEKILELRSYAQEKGVTLQDPSPELLEVALDTIFTDFRHNWQSGAVQRINAIVQIAKESRITLNMKDQFQKVYIAHLNRGSIGKMRDIENFAASHKVSLELTNESAQNAYDYLILKDNLDDAIELEAYVSRKNISLTPPSKDILQKIYDDTLSEGQYQWIINAVQVIEYAAAKNITLSLPSTKVFQTGFEKCLERGGYEWMEHADQALLYAENKGIVFDIDVAFQNAYEYMQKNSYINALKDLRYYASQKKVLLDSARVSKPIQEKNLQSYVGSTLEKGDIATALEIISYAKTKGLDVSFSKKVTSIFEESYIRLIHNNTEGHAEGKRKMLIQNAEAQGIVLDYEESIKMDFLDFLDLSPKERYSQNHETMFASTKIQCTFIGEIVANQCQGKYVLSKHKDTNQIQFIFDSTMGEHADFSTKYNVEVVGGGWLNINMEHKEVLIKNSSLSFGYEPRIVSIKVILDCFPEYAVVIDH